MFNTDDVVSCMLLATSYQYSEAEVIGSAVNQLGLAFNPARQGIVDHEAGEDDKHEVF